MEPIQNLSQAMSFFEQQLILRNATIKKKENVVADYFNGRPVFHGRIWVEIKGIPELYQVKFTREGYRLKPTEKLSSGAKELDEKLRFTLRTFGNGDETMNGLNEDIVLELYNKTLVENIQSYFVTVMANYQVYVSSIVDFYEFCMRYDTFFKFPRSQVPVCEVPTGWMRQWTQVISSFPVTPE